MWRKAEQASRLYRLYSTRHRIPFPIGAVLIQLPLNGGSDGDVTSTDVQSAEPAVRSSHSGRRCVTRCGAKVVLFEPALTSKTRCGAVSARQSAAHTDSTVSPVLSPCMPLDIRQATSLGHPLPPPLLLPTVRISFFLFVSFLFFSFLFYSFLSLNIFSFIFSFRRPVVFGHPHLFLFHLSLSFSIFFLFV